MRLEKAAPHELPDLWPKIRDRIAGCCERSGGKYAPLDVLNLILRGQMVLWLGLDENNGIHAVALTEIVHYPRIKVCKLLAGTGDDAEQWYRLIDGMERWAKSQGCAVFEPICRPGWERHLKPLGYRKTHIVMEKSL